MLDKCDIEAKEELKKANGGKFPQMKPLLSEVPVEGNKEKAPVIECVVNPRDMPQAFLSHHYR